MANWDRKIEGLRRLISEVGSLWPDSTKLAGFASNGPYSCSNCEYFKGSKTGGVCHQEVMKADHEVRKNSFGLPIISSPGTQCCEFVEPPK